MFENQSKGMQFKKQHNPYDLLWVKETPFLEAVKNIRDDSVNDLGLLLWLVDAAC
jgi:hypothetical protein